LYKQWGDTIVATVQIEILYGTSPGTFSARDTDVVANGGGTRYMTYDDGSDSSITTYPIPIPTATNGASGSYWVTHCLNCTVAPDTYIKNVKYYQTWTSSPCADWDLSGAGWAGTGIKPGLYIGISSQTIVAARNYISGGQGFPSSNYIQAGGGQGVYGYLISGYARSGWNGAHLYYSGANRDGAPASGGMVSILNFNNLSNAYIVQSGNMVGAATGRSHCIVTQCLVGSGATAGNKTDKTATFSYTEA